MIEITLADYSNPAHAQAVIAMLDAYAKDPMGGSEGISDEVKENLIKARKAFFALGCMGAFQGVLNPLSTSSIFESCVMLCYVTITRDHMI